MSLVPKEILLSHLQRAEKLAAFSHGGEKFKENAYN